MPDEQREQEERCPTCYGKPNEPLVLTRPPWACDHPTFHEPDPEPPHYDDDADLSTLRRERDEAENRSSLLAARVEELERELSQVVRDCHTPQRSLIEEKRGLRKSNKDLNACLERCQEALRAGLKWHDSKFPNSPSSVADDLAAVIEQQRAALSTESNQPGSEG